MFFRKKSKKRVFVLSLDGVPFTLLEKKFKDGKFPNLKRLFTENGSFRQMYSVIPTISSVAWSTFLTGKNPAKHGIFGFVDRTPNPLKIFIPTGRNLKSKTLPEILSEAGKKVVSINVPGTTPPPKVNGVVIADFLSTSLEKVAYPPKISEKLKEFGYIIDVNPMLAKKNLDKFIDDLHTAVEKRKLVAQWLMKEVKDWDFFMLHIMETDRIMHFVWAQMEKNDPHYAPRFWSLFELADQVVGEIRDSLPPETLFISLSDHGFCKVKAEVYTNYWLKEKGYLKFLNDQPKELTDMDSKTKVYSLIPGRFYVNLLGRESIGSVPQSDYETWREKIAQELLELKNPQTGEPIVKKVFKREEIYSGPHLEDAADLLVLPHDGYDLKGNLNPDSLTKTSHINGMHTYDDAYLFIENSELINKEPIYLYDVTATILEHLGVSIPGDFDGVSLIKNIT